MVIHTKDRETDRLVRQYADKHNLGISEAVKKAVVEGLAAPEAETDERPLEERLAPLLGRLDRLPREAGQPAVRGRRRRRKRKRKRWIRDRLGCRLRFGREPSLGIEGGRKTSGVAGPSSPATT